MSYYHNDIKINDISVGLFELMDLYQMKKMIFSDRSMVTSGKQRLARESIDALLYGIPYPHVYVSETQYGDYLVLEADNRLRCLIEYIAGKFSVDMSGLSLGDEKYQGRYYLSQLIKFEELDSRYRQDILRSKIQLCIIEYENPLHMHMRIGSYIGKWTIYQEEAIRRKMYSYKGFEKLTRMLEVNTKPQNRLVIEAELIAFLTYVYSFVLDDLSSENLDKYFMQERMILSLNDDWSEVSKLVDVYQLARQKLYSTQWRERFPSKLLKDFEKKNKQFKPSRSHLLGIAACVCKNPYNVEDIMHISVIILRLVCDSVYAAELEPFVKNCDLSSYSIDRLIKKLKPIVQVKMKKN